MSKLVTALPHRSGFPAATSIIPFSPFIFIFHKTMSTKSKMGVTECMNARAHAHGAMDRSTNWIKHYSSRQSILLVGEGDFSFSASLAVAFLSAPKMVATSLDSPEFLVKNYRQAESNIRELRNRECSVVHGVDATQMLHHPHIGHLKFDRIIFNFPYAGNFRKLSRDEQLRRHRQLVSLFLKNAKRMIRENSEIHITHKSNGFFREWNLESIGASHGLGLIKAVKFNRLKFPGYYTRRGFGGNGYFNCNPSKTYIFGLKKLS